MNSSTTLYSHQQRAVEKLIRSRIGALFMDMGTGKTRTAIEFVLLRQARIDKVVWFCPVSLKETIAAEIRKHTDTPFEAIYQFDDSTSATNIPAAFWYIVGTESMSSSGRVVLAANALVTEQTFVILDESSYIKGHNSLRSMRITEICKRARYRMILTGTPISQGVEDLYAQARFLSPEIFGYHSFYAFANNHLEYSEKYPGMVVRNLHTPYLAERLAPYAYQVTKDECLSLPGKLYDVRYFSMTDEQREAYESTKWEILMETPGDELDSYTIFKLFTALQQIVCGYRRHDRNTVKTYAHKRIKTLLEVLSDIPSGEKVIIWSKLLFSIDEISAALSSAYGPDAIAVLHGGKNERERNQEIERFRKSARFLIATQATGGHGLTLNEAHYQVFYSNEFKYSNRIQAEDRCHRIGQEYPVTYIDIVCSRSIDDRIMTALGKKEDAVKAFRREVDRIKDKRRSGLDKLIESL